MFFPLDFFPLDFWGCGQVAVGGLPCVPVTLQGAWSHEHVACTAPPRALGVPPTVVLTVASQPSQPLHLTYDSPVLHSVVRARTLAVWGLLYRGPTLVVTDFE